MLIKHSIIYFIGKLIPAILSVLGVVIYTRLASPDSYGLFSLITVIVSLVNILFFQWLRSSFLKFYNNKDQIEKFNNTFFQSHIKVLLIVGSIAMILSIIFEYYFSIGVYFFFGFLMMVLLSVYEMFIIYYRSRLQPKIISQVQTLNKFLTIIVTTILLFYGAGVAGLLIGVASGNLLSILIFYFKSNLEIRKFSRDVNQDTKKEILKYGLPITFSFALGVAMQNIDKLMISAILGLNANGNYAVSYDLLHNLLYMIMTSISLAGLPLIFRKISEKGEKEGKKQFYNYSNMLFFISIPSVIGMIAIIEEFKNVMIGSEYNIPSELLILIVFATLFQGLKSYYFDIGLQISGKAKYFFLPSLIAITINIVLNYFLLNSYGINGAAFATTASFFIAMLLSFFYQNKVYKVKKPWMNLMKITISSGIMYLCIYFVGINNLIISLLVKIILGAIIYLLVSLLLNSVNTKELLKNQLRKQLKTNN
ncbi:hypothetical protein CHL76_01205 [Marinococcus halophilus]|uniref:Stage V sporulation protein B n=1 Tax=Marinococcus halophilus TaxID=1371 RepID=A0A510Y2Z1_MARHA|nr:polysaccharide biosynthesis C-terminal domain-containing protein [Marinococcus halophilus]OZT81740.1 hypothetical protein CHL76_01205 [Marinococcus halophilus]GEK57698.1 stage V sporulation protein B [Marinococcus halophilus]